MSLETLNLAKKSMLPVIFLIAFMSQSSLALTTNYPVTVKSCDREVTYDKTPSAAVSNDVNLTEIMLALELQDRMVGFTGVSGWKTLHPSIREGIGELPELSPKYPTKEVLLGADVDFYFAGWNYGMTVGGGVTPATLASVGIKVYELTESCIHIMDKKKASIEDLYVDIQNLGKIFDSEEKANNLINSYKKELFSFKAKLSPLKKAPRVFVYDSGQDEPFTSGRLGMPTALIEEAGGKNIVDDVEKSWTRIGWEAVIDREPEVIIIVNYGEVTAQEKIEFMRNKPSFANIPAVKNNRFVVLEYVEATPGPQNIQAIKRLAKAFRSDS